MKPQTRVELVDLLPPNALVIELGVAAGNFAAEMMARNATMQYIGIDRWSDHHGESEYLKAKDTIEALGGTIIRLTFAEARIDFPADCADLIYVDGYAHTGQEGGETLRDWWHSVKSGGIFAGHDYDAKEYPQTVAAVDEFVAQHGLELNLTCENRLPSWWVRNI